MIVAQQLSPIKTHGEKDMEEERETRTMSTTADTVCLITHFGVKYCSFLLCYTAVRPLEDGQRSGLLLGPS